MMKLKHDIFFPLDNNCYLIIDEKTNESALIDCSQADDKMKKLIGDTDLKYIILTHGHFDHIGGVEEIRKEYKAKVAISKEDAPMLDSPPDILISDGDVIHLGSLEIRAISTPGHTKGGMCYIVENRLFTGDTLFKLSCGRTDFAEGDEREMLSSLRKLKALDKDYYVYPGHGEFSSLDFERKNNPYMNM